MTDPPLIVAAREGNDQRRQNCCITVGLYQAIVSCHDKVLDLLCSAKLITTTNKHVCKALFDVTKSGNKTYLSRLLNACPDLVHAVDDRGSTVLHWAAFSGQDDAVAQILALRPEMVSVVDFNGWNALIWAIYGDSCCVAETLLAIKPDSIFHVSGGNTVLNHAVIHCCDSPLAKLWRLNPQALTQANAEGRTPFYYAVRTN